MKVLSTLRFLFPLAACALAVVVLSGTTGCDLLTFTFELEEQLDSQIIDGDPSGGILGGASEQIVFTSWQDPDFGSEGGVLKAIVVAEITFEIAPESTEPTTDPIEDGEPDDFAFVDSVEIYVEAWIDGVQRRELIAFIEEGNPQLVPGVDTVTLRTTGLDILDFADADGSLQITMEATGVMPPDRVVFTGHVVYEVTVDLF